MVRKAEHHLNEAGGNTAPVKRRRKGKATPPRGWRNAAAPPAAPPTRWTGRQHHPQRRRTAAPGEGNAAFLWVALAPPFFSLCGAAVTIGVFGVVLLSSLLLWIGTAFTIFLDPDIYRVLLRIVAFFRCGLWQPKNTLQPTFIFLSPAKILTFTISSVFAFASWALPADRRKDTDASLNSSKHEL